MTDFGYQRRKRAPGAEHPVRPVKAPVNPNQLQRVTPADIAALLRHAAGVAIGLTLYRHRPEQVTPGHPNTPQERIR